MRNILLRSMLFVPGHNAKFIEKALVSDADAIILDMEDAIPPNLRQDARENIINYFNKGSFKDKTVFIRINELGSEDFIQDIRQLIFEDLTGYMLPKINHEDDIKFFSRLLDLVETERKWERGKFLLTPLIETTSALYRVNQIATASERMLALCFGGEDYLNDLGSTYTHYENAFLVPRANMVNAARMAGIQPIDTPYLQLNDTEGYMREETEMYRMGFAGHLLINPKQIELANKCFSPSDEEIVFSKDIMQGAELAQKEKSSGISVHGGVMIGPPMIKRAQTVLQQYELILKKQEK